VVGECASNTGPKAVVWKPDGSVFYLPSFNGGNGVARGTSSPSRTTG